MANPENPTRVEHASTEHAENRLAVASSAYLRSAAHQPIDWYEFGPEAFERARTLDRPLLLDIGAVWCHWCHVIDRESYEDPDIAQIINQHYVAVKVDRDQRPDVDSRYQQVVMSMTGQGGWPLTAFLTHDGRVIYGGTYFPPQTMKSLLNQIHQVYQQEKANIFASNAEQAQGEPADKKTDSAIASTILALSTLAEADAHAQLKTATDTMLEHILSRYDGIYGGFGQQPKFPHFSTLQWLIQRVQQHELEGKPNAPLKSLVLNTLEEMARGGIYDQLAGGFHRYSVDRVWHVPHFEKMAYDNAEALTVYSQAARLFKHAYFEEITDGILRWVTEHLSDTEQGGFYASQDADIDLHDDGDHFTWSRDEILSVLNAEQAELAMAYYDVNEAGDMHDRPGRNVLWAKQSLEEVAVRFRMSPHQLVGELADIKSRLYQHRLAHRPVPFIDTTLYTNWNGMMIVGFLEAADLLQRPEAQALALRSLERMLHLFYLPNQRVFHTEGIHGLLEDYAWLGLAALRAHESTGNATYLAAANDIAALMIQQFSPQTQDSTDFQESVPAFVQGFFDTATEETPIGLLKYRRRPLEDSPSSSANATALQLLYRLSVHQPNSRYGQWVQATLCYLLRTEGGLAPLGLFVSALGILADWQHAPPLKIELVGNAPEAWQQAVCSVFFPGKMVVHPQPSTSPDQPHEVRPGPEIRLCVGRQCLAPITTTEALEAILQSPNRHFSAGLASLF